MLLIDGTPSPSPAHARACSASAPSRGRWVLGALLAAGFLPVAHAARHPKPVKAAVELVAKGQVVHDGTAVNGAVVYLEDPKSLAIKSYLTADNGQFHFSNIAPQTDYEVWAEQNGVESKHKFISQFSSHTSFVFTLKLEPAKKHKLLGIL